MDVCSGLSEPGTCQCSTGFTLSRHGTHCEGWVESFLSNFTLTNKDLWFDDFISTVTMTHVFSVCLLQI